MAIIVPFQCIHPAPEYAAQVAALPYDVYNRKEAAKETAKHPLSFLNIDRPETQFPPDADMYAPQVYEKANELLQSWLRRGVLEKEAERGYALYEQTMNKRTQTGLVACASIDDYCDQVIRRHENTRPEKEEDRVRHIDACSAQTGPIFLAYRKNAVIQEITEHVKCGCSRTLILWRRTGYGIGAGLLRIRSRSKRSKQRLRVSTGSISQTDITGRHRQCVSDCSVSREHPGYDGTEEFNYFLSVLFPDEELQILDYNRVIRDLNGRTPKELLQEAEKVFEVRPCAGSGEALHAELRRKGELLLYLANRWYHPTIRPGIPERRSGGWAGCLDSAGWIPSSGAWDR